jgi:hypothetical protein
MLEERHPAFAGLLVVIAERRKAARFLGQVSLFVVAVLTREWN